jgi:hypothetical protein
VILLFESSFAAGERNGIPNRPAEGQEDVVAIADRELGQVSGFALLAADAAYSGSRLGSDDGDQQGQQRGGQGRRTRD